MVERVRALKVESAGTGGDAGDEVEYPSPIQPSEDFLDARGLALQDDSSDDETVTVTRDADGNMVFKDQVADGGGVGIPLILLTANAILVDDITLDALADDVTKNVLVNV